MAEPLWGALPGQGCSCLVAAIKRQWELQQSQGWDAGADPGAAAREHPRLGAGRAEMPPALHLGAARGGAPRGPCSVHQLLPQRCSERQFAGWNENTPNPRVLTLCFSHPQAQAWGNHWGSLAGNRLRGAHPPHTPCRWELRFGSPALCKNIIVLHGGLQSS